MPGFHRKANSLQRAFTSDKSVSIRLKHESPNKSQHRHSQSYQQLPLPPIALSQQVQLTNAIIEKQMNELKSFKLKQKKSHRDDGVQHDKILKQLKKEFEITKQIVDRTLPSDDSHTVINERNTYSISVLEENLMTFRVPCKNASSPAKFML